MKCTISFGSNLGNRRENLESAAKMVAKLSRNHSLRVSTIYETPALVPEDAPKEWNLPYLNAVGSIHWDGNPRDLLKKLKDIEKEMGRTEANKWAPRIIDLDLLLFGNEVVVENGLRIPHPEILNRSFVLDPLKDLDPQLRIPGYAETVLVQARRLETHSPWVMAVLNLTPDSFSDGGEAQTLKAIDSRIEWMERAGVQAIDIGAESTRPGASLISVQEERERLVPAFAKIHQRNSNTIFKPFLSIDTRRAEIANLALENGFQCINDVSGLSDPAMLELLIHRSCDYVLMHSLSVPADPNKILLSRCDPVMELKKWLNEKLEILDAKGIDLNRIIFDPGIGFGKTAEQSIAILERLHEFADLPVRVLVGHSRKSFLKAWKAGPTIDKDAATLSISVSLARKGVDILRVHDFESHLAEFKKDREVSK